jgi:hypothetical protein
MGRVRRRSLRACGNADASHDEEKHSQILEDFHAIFLSYCFREIESAEALFCRMMKPIAPIEHSASRF